MNKTYYHDLLARLRRGDTLTALELEIVRGKEYALNVQSAAELAGMRETMEAQMARIAEQDATIAQLRRELRDRP